MVRRGAGLGAAAATLAMLAVATAQDCTTVATAAQDNGLDTLVAAVSAAFEGLPDFATAAQFLVDGSDARAVFAPTNEAFDALFSALNTTAEDLLASSLDTVGGVLAYHVSSSSDFGDSVETLLTDAMPLMLSNGTVAAGCSNASILAGPVDACGSSVYVIDSVLLPDTFC